MLHPTNEHIEIIEFLADETEQDSRTEIEKINSTETNKEEIGVESVVENDELKATEKENSDNAETNEGTMKKEKEISYRRTASDGNGKICRLK